MCALQVISICIHGLFCSWISPTSIIRIALNYQLMPSVLSRFIHSKQTSDCSSKWFLERNAAGDGRKQFVCDYRLTRVCKSFNYTDERRIQKVHRTYCNWWNPKACVLWFTFTPHSSKSFKDKITKQASNKFSAKTLNAAFLRRNIIRIHSY